MWLFERRLGHSSFSCRVRLECFGRRLGRRWLRQRLRLEKLEMLARLRDLKRRLRFGRLLDRSASQVRAAGAAWCFDRRLRLEGFDWPLSLLEPSWIERRSAVSQVRTAAEDGSRKAWAAAGSGAGEGIASRVAGALRWYSSIALAFRRLPMASTSEGFGRRSRRDQRLDFRLTQPCALANDPREGLPLLVYEVFQRSGLTWKNP